MSAIAQTRFEILRSLGKRRKGGFRYGPEPYKSRLAIYRQTG
jgi:hypothetical protein